MNAPVTVTLSEFAVIIDCSPSYVTKLKQAGRLVLIGDRVDVEASKLRIAQTAGGRHNMAEHWQQPFGEEDPSPVSPETSAMQPDYGTRAYWERMDREEVARIRQIERRKLEGALVEREAVDFVLNDFGATLRGLLENLADRLAPQVFPLETLEETRFAIGEAVEDLQREMAETMKRRMEGLTS